jgi:hypothetical protein
MVTSIESRHDNDYICNKLLAELDIIGQVNSYGMDSNRTQQSQIYTASKQATGKHVTNYDQMTEKVRLSVAG